MMATTNTFLHRKIISTSENVKDTIIQLQYPIKLLKKYLLKYTYISCLKIFDSMTVYAEFRNHISLPSSSKYIFRKYGINYTIQFILTNISVFLLPWLWYNKYIRKKKKLFKFNGKKYEYFHHQYNCTWYNERCVELPIILKQLKNQKYKRILEIGNVLNHYIKVKHDVIDKYEKFDKVKNIDIVDFKSEIKYDLIISISTMEHIGFEENYTNDINESKIINSFKNLKSLIKDNGTCIITIPINQNPILDKLIFEEQIQFEHKYYLKRISKSNEWIEIDLNDSSIYNIRYGKPYFGANCIFIGILKCVC
jgi:hypothetical protein